jgi:hypothetical protein
MINVNRKIGQALKSGNYKLAIKLILDEQTYYIDDFSADEFAAKIMRAYPSFLDQIVDEDDYYTVKDELATQIEKFLAKNN